MAAQFGSQCIVLSVDARTVPAGSAPTPSGWEVTTHGGRRGTGIDAVEWAARGAELGVGEILLNSMDADGTRAGFEASTEFSRKDFGLEWNVALEGGGVLVGDKVKVELEVEAVLREAKPAEAPAQ